MFIEVPVVLVACFISGVHWVGNIALHKRITSGIVEGEIMEEDVVKKVFVRYLWNLGKRPVSRKKNVPGPDVIIRGYAYECKGSRFEKSTLFKQLVSYALQYSGVGVVLPWDSLDCLFIHQLEALEVLLSARLSF